VEIVLWLQTWFLILKEKASGNIPLAADLVPDMEEKGSRG